MTFFPSRASRDQRGGTMWTYPPGVIHPPKNECSRAMPKAVIPRCACVQSGFEGLPMPNERWQLIWLFVRVILMPYERPI